MSKLFLLGIDEDLYGDKMHVLTDELEKQHIPATIFIDFKTSMSRSYIRELKDTGFDLQMHWVRYPRRKYKRLGYYAGYFFKDEPEFSVQKATLESLLDKQIVGNRTHGLEWKCPFPRTSKDDFVYPWRVMAENGISFSSSTLGFPHPFKLSEFNGLVELPITHFERVPVNGSELVSELVVGCFHPHYPVCLEAVEWALKHDYVFKTFTEYIREVTV